MFIGRRPDGSIYGAWTCKQPEDADHPGIEELPGDHPDVVAFFKRAVQPNNTAALAARQTDKALDDMQRAIDAGDTAGALRLTLQLLQERK